MSTASGDIVRKRRARARRPIHPVTWVLLVFVLIVVFGSLAIILANIWPTNGGVTQPPAGSVTPSSANAAFVKVEKVGTPVRGADGQVTVQAVITNVQSPVVRGTPTPGAPTPTLAPEPAKIINATVKVIFFDRDASDPSRQIVGSAIGNYYDPNGLAAGQSATISVVATDVADFKDYQVSVDTVFTDKDPVKTPTVSP